MIDSQINRCSFSVRFLNAICTNFMKELSTYLNESFSSEELGVNSKGECWAGIPHSHAEAVEQYNTVLEVIMAGATEHWLPYPVYTKLPLDKKLMMTARGWTRMQIWLFSVKCLMKKEKYILFQIFSFFGSCSNHQATVWKVLLNKV